MKKIVLFICCVAAFMLSSCNNSSDTTDGLTTIHIEHEYVESGSMTRTNIIVPEIEDALMRVVPQSISLTISRDPFTVFYCKTGEDIVLPYDCSYAVTGKSEQEKTIIDDGLYASTEPLVVIDDTINVIYGVKNYVVSANINSFVIAWNNSVVKCVTLNDTTVLPSINVGNTSVCCITGDGDFDITLNTWEGQPYESRTFTLTTSPDGLGIRCEPGKWYALRPNSKTCTDGAICLQYDAWVEGGSYY